MAIKEFLDNYRDHIVSLSLLEYKNKENIVIEKDKIYTIKNFEKGWVYLKEFGDYNGEFKNEKFELETGFKVCLINDKKLCLIDKNNAIIFSIILSLVKFSEYLLYAFSEYFLYKLFNILGFL
jgi:hypothetical protein